ncbi:balbiani ring protein 3-like isoform X7 [Euwallacea similis]|uniref:balbiani ring protein 3-like isoform X7 n=1 Tax=Euwallacea similis TaxID=1736056 RepID=UPI00344F45C5
MHPKSASLLLFLGWFTAMVKSAQNGYCYEKCMNERVRRDPQSNINIFLEYQKAEIKVPTPSRVKMYGMSEFTNGNRLPEVNLRESYIVDPVEEGCKSKSLKKTASRVKCKPRPIIVDLIPTSGKIIYNKVLTKRCSGFCSNNQECMAVETQNTSVSVMMLTSEGTSQCSTVVIPIHIKCKCRCRITEKDCNLPQKYHKQSCSCRCSNERDKTDCMNRKPAGKFSWNETTCSCECKRAQKQQCTTGTFWDKNQCKCSKKADNG